MVRWCVQRIIVGTYAISLLEMERATRQPPNSPGRPLQGQLKSVGSYTCARRSRGARPARSQPRAACQPRQPPGQVHLDVHSVDGALGEFVPCFRRQPETQCLQRGEVIAGEIQSPNKQSPGSVDKNRVLSTTVVHTEGGAQHRVDLRRVRVSGNQPAPAITETVRHPLNFTTRSAAHSATPPPPTSPPPAPTSRPPPNTAAAHRASSVNSSPPEPGQTHPPPEWLRIL